MRVIAIRTLRDFWEKSGRHDAEPSLRSWYAEAKKANWKLPEEIKADYRSASVVGNNRVVFNIKDRFMSDEDDTGYHDTISAMMGDSLEALKVEQYCHRLSMSGDPLHYYAVVGRKKSDIALS